MGGFENDYLSNLEAGTEQREGEKFIERIDYNNRRTTQNEEEINIEEATLLSLKVIEDLMLLEEDVEDAIKVALESRVDIIKKLRQEGKLDDLCTDLLDRIDKYIEKSANYDEKINDEGR